MGYSLNLIKDGVTAKLPCPVLIGGSIYSLHGTSVAEYAATYNYAEHFREAFGNERGIYNLEGKTAGESIPMIEEAIQRLSEENKPPTVKELKAQIKKYQKAMEKAKKSGKPASIIEDLYSTYIREREERIRTADPKTGRAQPSYWDATPGNARKALEEILVLAKLADKDAVWEIS